jgi:patatin-like phospholipase/acyl hydrolase
MNDVSKDALLSDVCISTSAAPTYLPGHQFETKDKDGKPRAFNLIDGGVAANNPVSHHRLTTYQHKRTRSHETMHNWSQMCCCLCGKWSVIHGVVPLYHK